MAFRQPCIRWGAGIGALSIVPYALYTQMIEATAIIEEQTAQQKPAPRLSALHRAKPGLPQHSTRSQHSTAFTTGDRQWAEEQQSRAQMKAITAAPSRLLLDYPVPSEATSGTQASALAQASSGGEGQSARKWQRDQQGLSSSHSLFDIPQGTTQMAVQTQEQGASGMVEPGTDIGCRSLSSPSIPQAELGEPLAPVTPTKLTPAMAHPTVTPPRPPPPPLLASGIKAAPPPPPLPPPPPVGGKKAPPPPPPPFTRGLGGSAGSSESTDGAAAKAPGRQEFKLVLKKKTIVVPSLRGVTQAAGTFHTKELGELDATSIAMLEALQDMFAIDAAPVLKEREGMFKNAVDPKLGQTTWSADAVLKYWNQRRSPEEQLAWADVLKLVREALATGRSSVSEVPVEQLLNLVPDQDKLGALRKLSPDERATLALPEKEFFLPFTEMENLALLKSAARFHATFQTATEKLTEQLDQLAKARQEFEHSVTCGNLAVALSEMTKALKLFTYSKNPDEADKVVGCTSDCLVRMCEVRSVKDKKVSIVGCAAPFIKTRLPPGTDLTKELTWCDKASKLTLEKVGGAKPMPGVVSLDKQIQDLRRALDAEENGTDPSGLKQQLEAALKVADSVAKLAADKAARGVGSNEAVCVAEEQRQWLVNHLAFVNMCIAELTKREEAMAAERKASDELIARFNGRGAGRQDTSVFYTNMVTFTKYLNTRIRALEIKEKEAAGRSGREASMAAKAAKKKTPLLHQAKPAPIAFKLTRTKAAITKPKSKATGRSGVIKGAVRSLYPELTDAQWEALQAEDEQDMGCIPTLLPDEWEDVEGACDEEDLIPAVRQQEQVCSEPLVDAIVHIGRSPRVTVEA